MDSGSTTTSSPTRSASCRHGSVEGNPELLREAVRRRYADGACCRPDGCGPAAFGAELYAADDLMATPDTAARVSLGCGNPTAVAELHAGETVLDLGSGGGLDVLLSARRVGPTGRAYGLDMTDEMLELARRNQAIPPPDSSVDVVISNCVINLSADKAAVLREAARVLRPGGRFAITDVIADPGMADATRTHMQLFTGCIAGALTRRQFEDALADAGLVDLEIRETHRVHAHAGSAIVRARKPSSCCGQSEQADCCQPTDKQDCCGAKAPESGCGCR